MKTAKTVRRLSSFKQLAKIYLPHNKCLATAEKGPCNSRKLPPKIHIIYGKWPYNRQKADFFFPSPILWALESGCCQPTSTFPPCRLPSKQPNPSSHLKTGSPYKRPSTKTPPPPSPRNANERRQSWQETSPLQSDHHRRNSRATIPGTLPARNDDRRVIQH